MPKTKTPEPIVVHLTYESTKTKVIRYAECDADGNMLERDEPKTLGSTYLSKKALKAAGYTKIPRTITVTIMEGLNDE